jgi:hypothetical protein
MFPPLPQSQQRPSVFSPCGLTSRCVGCNLLDQRVLAMQLISLIIIPVNGQSLCWNTRDEHPATMTATDATRLNVPFWRVWLSSSNYKQKLSLRCNAIAFHRARQQWPWQGEPHNGQNWTISQHWIESAATVADNRHMASCKRIDFTGWRPTERSVTPSAEKLSIFHHFHELIRPDSAFSTV